MSSHKLLLGVALLLSVAVIATGCGEDDDRPEGGGSDEPKVTTTLESQSVDDSYQETITEAEQRLQDRMRTIFDGADPTVEELDGGIDELRAQAKILRQASPPPEVKQANQQYINGINGFIKVLTQVKQSGADPDQAAEILTGPDGFQATNDLEAASNKLREEGYLGG